jgi:hypothetical protein
MPRGRPRKIRQEAERILEDIPTPKETEVLRKILGPESTFGDRWASCSYCNTGTVRVKTIDHGSWVSYICKVCDRKSP